MEVYLSDLGLPDHARVLEIGCGTGAISRIIARRPGVAQVVGVDPSSVLVAKARELATGISNVSFEEADGRHLPMDEETFDAAVLHRVVSHIPKPECVLAQASRVLRPGGSLALFDGGLRHDHGRQWS